MQVTRGVCMLCAGDYSCGSCRYGILRPGISASSYKAADIQGTWAVGLPYNLRMLPTNGWRPLLSCVIAIALHTGFGSQHKNNCRL